MRASSRPIIPIFRVHSAGKSPDNRTTKLTCHCFKEIPCFLFPCFIETVRPIVVLLYFPLFYWHFSWLWGLRTPKFTICLFQARHDLSFSGPTMAFSDSQTLRFKWITPKFEATHTTKLGKYHQKDKWLHLTHVHPNPRRLRFPYQTDQKSGFYGGFALGREVGRAQKGNLKKR